jgi:DNA replication protein DnaC
MANELYSFARGVYHPKSTPHGRVVVIYGQNGCGKTHAIRAFKSWFDHVRLNIGPQVVTTEDGEDAVMPDCCYRMWPAVVDGFKRDQWLIVDALMHSYLTIIDDIGAEHDPSRIGVEKLYLILSRREFKNTLITTNFPPGEWGNKFEQRIASRLFRNTTHIDLSDVPDYNAP